jgi:hypothetical protein
MGGIIVANHTKSSHLGRSKNSSERLSEQDAAWVASIAQAFDLRHPRHDPRHRRA